MFAILHLNSDFETLLLSGLLCLLMNPEYLEQCLAYGRYSMLVELIIHNTWVLTIHTSIFKIVNQQGSTIYSTGNSIQHPIIN